MSNEHLNYEQMRLTHGHINSLTGNKEMRGLLGHLVDNSPTRVIASGGGSKHIKLYFENDGIVTMASSPSDSHAVQNADKQIRRSLAGHGIEYTTLSEFKRPKKKNKNKGNPEQPEEPQQV